MLVRRALVRLPGHVSLTAGIAALAVASFFGLTVLNGATASAATPAGSFCNDAVQLENWFAQGFLPGIDQYQLNPNRAYVKGEAVILQKLANEAPLAIRPDLSAWASFTEELAAEASPAELGKEVGSVSADAQKVNQWLKAKSGCDVSYAVPRPTTGKHNGVSPVVWIVVGIAAGLIVLGALFLGSQSDTGGEQGKTKVAGPRTSEPPKREIPDFTPKQQIVSCSKCSGNGEVTCYRCQGTTRIPTTPELRGTADHYQRCDNYMCNGGRVTCQDCRGSGKESVYR
jgi:hypothetical protein